MPARASKACFTLSPTKLPLSAYTLAAGTLGVVFAPSFASNLSFAISVVTDKSLKHSTSKSLCLSPNWANTALIALLRFSISAFTWAVLSTVTTCGAAACGVAVGSAVACGAGVVVAALA